MFRAPHLGIGERDISYKHFYESELVILTTTLYGKVIAAFPNIYCCIFDHLLLD
jgi:hypothetical protein